MRYKKTLALIVCLLIGVLGAQTLIDFDNDALWTPGSGTLGSYQLNHSYTDGLFSATGGPAMRNTNSLQDGYPGALGIYSWRLQNVESTDWWVCISSGGVGSFSLKIRRWDGSPSPNFLLEYSTDNGQSWQSVDTITNESLGFSSAWTTFGSQINSSADDLLIRLRALGATERIMVDDFYWEEYTAPQPILSADANFVPFYTYEGSPSAPQTYNLIGQYLTGPIQIDLPQGFELSFDDGQSYQLDPQLPSDWNGTVYLRLTGIQEGVYSGYIVHNSPGAVSLSIYVSGECSDPASGFASDLFISEYVEGSSYRKALELFNGTGEAIDLSMYSLRKQTNGVGEFGNELMLQGYLEDNDCYVIAYTSASQGSYIVGDYVDLYSSSYALTFNGNDAVALYKNGVMLDLVGYPDDPAIWGQDCSLVRSPDISDPQTLYHPEDWISYPVDTLENLGSHNFNNNPPQISAPTIQASALRAAAANTSISLSWTPGNGSRRIVLINQTDSFSVPVNGIDPLPNSHYAGSEEQVVYNNSTQIIENEPVNEVLITGLMPNTTYWFRIFEYNGTGALTVYQTATATGNPASFTTLNNQYEGYYVSVYGVGLTLKNNLHQLLRDTHNTQYSYNALWNQLQYTDEDPQNSDNIIEIYTGWSIPKDYYGTGNDRWNREHTWSKSHGDFGDVAPAGTDLHHLRPCDATVNSAKGNKDFDEGGSQYIDSSPYPGYSGNTGNYSTSVTWEPRDEDKGDVSRMLMYMALRYDATDTAYDLELVDATDTAGTSNLPYYGKLSTLLSWHVQDPPDNRELQRNQRIFERQGNRNPFVDHPEYASLIWSPVPSIPLSVGQTSFIATWSLGYSAIGAYLQVSADSLFSSFVAGYSNYNAGTSTSKLITGLDPGTTYYWRLRSFFGSGYSMYSPLGYVVTDSADPVPTLLSIEIESGMIQLNIEPISNASSYRIYASDTPNGIYQDITSSGSFVQSLIWQTPVADLPRRFYRAYAVFGD